MQKQEKKEEKPASKEDKKPEAKAEKPQPPPKEEKPAPKQESKPPPKADPKKEPSKVFLPLDCPQFCDLSCQLSVKTNSSVICESAAHLQNFRLWPHAAQLISICLC